MGRGNSFGRNIYYTREAVIFGKSREEVSRNLKHREHNSHLYVVRPIPKPFVKDTHKQYYYINHIALFSHPHYC